MPLARLAGISALISAVGLGGVFAFGRLKTQETVEAFSPAEAAFEPAEADTVPLADDAGSEPEITAALVEEYPGLACGNLKAEVYFEFDKTTPDMASMKVIGDAVARGFDCALVDVRIEAHDDLFNSPGYAQAVSERRASSLAAILAAQGVDSLVISTLAHGSS